MGTEEPRDFRRWKSTPGLGLRDLSINLQLLILPGTHRAGKSSTQGRAGTGGRRDRSKVTQEAEEEEEGAGIPPLVPLHIPLGAHPTWSPKPAPGPSCCFLRSGESLCWEWGWPGRAGPLGSSSKAQETKGRTLPAASKLLFQAPRRDFFPQGRVLAALIIPALPQGSSHILHHTNLPFPPV